MNKLIFPLIRNTTKYSFASTTFQLFRAHIYTQTILLLHVTNQSIAIFTLLIHKPPTFWRIPLSSLKCPFPIFPIQITMSTQLPTSPITPPPVAVINPQYGRNSGPLCNEPVNARLRASLEEVRVPDQSLPQESGIPRKMTRSLSNPSDWNIGRMQVTVMNVFLNIPLKKPYVRLTLGAQVYQTSTSSNPLGHWHECFEFRISFHAQLFDTCQLDLYESYSVFPDKHIGRAEIRLKHLEAVPEVFTSFYEIWEKRFSNSNSSDISRRKVLSSNIGAIQVKIRYKYQKMVGEVQQSRTESVSSTNGNRYRPNVSPAAENDDEDSKFAAEFKQHLMDERARNPNSTGFFKIDESGPTEIIDPLVKNIPEQTSLSLGPSVTNGASEQAMFSLNTPEDEEEVEWRVAYPILETMANWTATKDTNKVLKSIARMLAAFGQGFDLSNLQVLTGFTVLERFYERHKTERSGQLVSQLEEIELASYFWKFSMATYGWRGINFIGKGNGIWTDAIRKHSDALSIVEFLSIPQEDLLAYELRTTEVFKPSYFIARDRRTDSIVLAIRGTMSAYDTLTDLVCEYVPWKNGLAHGGMKSSAQWFMTNVVPKLIAYANKHETTGLYIVGHSLGAGAAAILTMMVLDYVDEFNKGRENPLAEPFQVKCFGYAPACSVSLELSERYSDYIQGYVFANDVVSKLSYGSMMDVKSLVIAGVEAGEQLGRAKVLLSSKESASKDEAWARAFEIVEETRKVLLSDVSRNPRLYVAGKVYQFWVDPTENNPTRTVVERTTPLISTEVIVRRSILFDHLPSNYDVVFTRARECLMLKEEDQADHDLNDTEQPLKETERDGILSEGEAENSTRENDNGLGIAKAWNKLLKKGMELTSRSTEENSGKDYGLI